MEGSTKACVSRLLVQLAWRALCSMQCGDSRGSVQEVIDCHVSWSGGQAHIVAVAVAGARASILSERAVRHTRSTKGMEDSGDQRRRAADSGVIYRSRKFYGGFAGVVTATNGAHSVVARSGSRHHVVPRARGTSPHATAQCNWNCQLQTYITLRCAGLQRRQPGLNCHGRTALYIHVNVHAQRLGGDVHCRPAANTARERE